ncbi:MAG: class F sortase [bacterium]|nr:class F sortase [bacterium]
MKRVVGQSFGLLLIMIGIGSGYIEFNNKSAYSYQADEKAEVKPVTARVMGVKKAEARVVKPAQLIIPAIKVAAPVKAMGLDGTKMAVPDNFTEVGWYKYGTSPGEKGSAVMGAHVDDGGRTAGVFKNLKNLKVGDDIYAVDSDGKAAHFRVTAKKVLPYRTKITDDVFMKKDTARLNLITCHGTFLPKENTYNQRLIIFTELVPKN